MSTIPLFANASIQARTSPLHGFHGSAQARWLAAPSHMGFYGSSTSSSATNAPKLDLVFVAHPASSKIRPRALSVVLSREVDLFEAGDNALYPDAGFARSSFEIKRGADCEGPYGCLGVEAGDPVLSLPSFIQGSSSAESNAEAALGVSRVLFSDRPASCILVAQTQATAGVAVGLVGEAQSALSTTDVPTREKDIGGLVILEVRLEGKAGIQTVALCCFSDFKVSSPLITSSGALVDGPAVTVLGDAYPNLSTSQMPTFRVFLKGEYFVRQGRADVFLDTGSSALNEYYTQQAVDRGVEFAYWVYQSDAWPTYSVSDRAYSRDPVTNRADVDIPKLLEILEYRHGLIQNHPTEVYVALDFEDDWLAALSEGTDPLSTTNLDPLNDQDFLGSNNRRATAAYVAITEACQAYFGPNVKFSNYGIPRIYNFAGNLIAPIWVTNPIGDPPETSVEWRNALPQNREIRIQRSVQQNTDVMQPFDWYMGTHYDAVPSADSLFENGGTVTQRGNTTPSGFPITDFDFDSLQDDQRQAASYNATYRIIGQNSPKPVFALLCDMYAAGVHFREDESGGPLDGPKAFQYIPIPEVVSRLQYLKLQNPKLNGVVLWNFGTFSHDTVAFTAETNPQPTGSTSETYWFRTSIVRELYGGAGLGSSEDPVFNGTFPAWDDPGLKADVATRYNDRILQLVDRIKEIFGPTPTGLQRAAAIAPRWTPEELGSSLLAWYEASDASNFVFETGVARWNDLSGNDLHLVQSATGSQPIRNENVNGLSAVVQFDGSNDALRSDPSVYSWPAPLAQPFTVIAVFVPPPYADLVNAARYWSGFQRTRITSNDSWVFGYNQYSVVGGQANYAGYSGSAFGAAAIYLGSPNSGVPSYSPNVVLSALTFNGVPNSVNRMYGTPFSAATTTNNNPLYGLCLGAESVSAGSVSFHSKVGFCEFMIVTGAVDTATLQKIEGYLAHKWGVNSSLVSTHPYRNVAPIKPRV